MTTKALEGVRVIEYGSFISAAYCCKLMADLGADIVKVEHPDSGDEARWHGPFLHDEPHPERSGLYLYLNLNKRGVTLDTATPTGQRLFGELVGGADILVENWRPGFLSKRGLDYERLRQSNPRLVMTSISAFGQTGPYRDYVAYHLNACAVGGVCTVGEPNREPLAYPLYQGHYQAGVHAATATLVALLQRDFGGDGQYIDIAEADVWASYHGGGGLMAFLQEGRVKMRTGHRTMGFYPWCVLPCKDGYISEIAVQGYQWKRFLELMGGGRVPDWYAKDPRFQDRLELSRKYADEMDKLQAPFLMEHTKEELFQMCLERRIPFAPLYTVEEVVKHPHLRARDYFVEAPNEDAGPLTYPGAPYKLSETPCAYARPAPRLGEHNAEVFKEIGLAPADLVELRRAGVI